MEKRKGKGRRRYKKATKNEPRQLKQFHLFVGLWSFSFFAHGNQFLVVQKKVFFNKKMHQFITIFFLLWLIPAAQIVHGYQAQDPYSSIREEERIYGQQGRRVSSPNGVLEETAGQRAEKALGEVREGIESAEKVGVPSQGRQRRESLLGLDVPYKAQSAEHHQNRRNEEQQQQQTGGGQRSKEGIFDTKEAEKQPPV